MWANLWPWQAEEQIPIGHITNGVHIPSWLAWQMQQLYDRHFPADWQRRMGEPEIWYMIQGVDTGEVWETHQALKNQLITFVRRRVSRQMRRRGEQDATVEDARGLLDPSILTIGFARRFATYKRAGLLLENLDRLHALVNNASHPVQFIFAGKAHPKDEPGKKLIQQVANLRHDPRFAQRIVYIEDYDINVCRHLVQGVDVWMNNPRRPLEASGTSGQKVVLNGGLNLSILDGWWAEAFDGKNGFAVGKGTSHVSDEITDRRDAEYLYDESGAIRDSAVLRAGCGRSAAGVDSAHEKFDQLVGLAIQLAPYGDGLRNGLLCSRRRWTQLPDALAPTVASSGHINPPQPLASSANGRGAFRLIQPRVGMFPRRRLCATSHQTQRTKSKEHQRPGSRLRNMHDPT